MARNRSALEELKSPVHLEKKKEVKVRIKTNKKTKSFGVGYTKKALKANSKQVK